MNEPRKAVAESVFFFLSFFLSFSYHGAVRKFRTAAAAAPRERNQAFVFSTFPPFVVTDATSAPKMWIRTLMESVRSVLVCTYAVVDVVVTGLRYASTPSFSVLERCLGI